MTAEPYATSVRIAAPPEAVYPYLTQAGPARALDGPVRGARPAARRRVHGRHQRHAGARPLPQGLDPPHRVVISWGFAGSDEVPPGSTTVEVTLQAVEGGTLLELVHRDLPGVQAERHAIGWGHFVPRLAVAGAGADPGPKPVGARS